MLEQAQHPDIPFKPGDLVIDRQNPAQICRYTGRWSKAGTHFMIELKNEAGGVKRRPLSMLEPVDDTTGVSIEGNLRNGHFGNTRDLQRLITYEKLKGTLYEVVYSMEAAQIDFYPYQFKPVLKFIHSPTERMILADEVGLGKTIESTLIWTEIQARRQASRLLVICPKILTKKWKLELRSKFQLDARIVDFQELQQEIAELRQNGPGYPFVLIASYTALRPPKPELGQLDYPPKAGEFESPKTRFLRQIRLWPYSHPPFDMVIFDEAHYMRNQATSTFHLGESLAAHHDAAVLCVSATPVHNSNTDLHSLLQLVDRNFFETQAMFDDLLEANRPTVNALNLLSQTSIPKNELYQAITGMAKNQYIRGSPNFKRFQKIIKSFDPDDKSKIAEAQDLAEKLNLLGNYINRTRRMQVAEERPIRTPKVLEVTYSREEMDLYLAILEIVRRRCAKDNRPFHIFQVMGLQLRAASCLPALAEEIRSGRLGNLDWLLHESLGEDVYNALGDIVDPMEDLENLDFGKLLDYDFEAHDSKFAELKEMVTTHLPDEKVVVFAYYRNTLAYLRRRLRTEGISVAVIHGGIDHDQRWEELDRFRDDQGPRILLSSEVGSEGIDLQFCRVLVNYDLPWNPMRVEQRIGRIDRVGQREKRLFIVNFKVAGTIEERLYDRLHAKLLLVANSLGDLESIIGETVQKLTVELMSRELTPREEKDLIDRAKMVIEHQVRDIKRLEESGEGLIALSDYVQKKVSEGRERGRYVQPKELEDYVSDFFEREFQGTQIEFNTPEDGCMRILLSMEARTSLADFVRDDYSMNAHLMRRRQLTISFRREALEKLRLGARRKIQFVNHLSPFIKWITEHNLKRDHTFFKTSALELENSFLRPGIYCYRIERWKMKGLTSRETLSYGVESLDNGTLPNMEEAEVIVQRLLRTGRDWDYVKCDTDQLLAAHSRLEDTMTESFGEAVTRFEDENLSSLQIKVQRAVNFFDRKIDQAERALKTLQEAGRGKGVIRATKGRIKREKENRAQRLSELNSRARVVDLDQEPIAAGIFRITYPNL